MSSSQVTLRRYQIGQSHNSNASRWVFLARPRHRILAHPKSRWTHRDGCSVLALGDALRSSSTATSLPGSNCRRLPALIAICHSTSKSRSSGLQCTSCYPASPLTHFSPPCSKVRRLCHVVLVGPLVLTLCTTVNTLLGHLNRAVEKVDVGKAVL